MNDIDGAQLLDDVREFLARFGVYPTAVTIFFLTMRSIRRHASSVNGGRLLCQQMDRCR